MSKNKGNIFLPIVSVVALMAIAAAGYFFWQNQLLNQKYIPQTNTYPAQEITSTPIPSLPPITKGSYPPETWINWKTYSNPDFGFSITYPTASPFVLEERSEPVYLAGETPFEANGIVVFAKGAGEGDGFGVRKIKDSAGVYDSLAEYGPLKDKSLNGQVFKEYHTVGMGMGYGYAITKNGSVYVFSSSLGPNNPIFEQMMQSLKFQ